MEIPVLETERLRLIAPDVSCAEHYERFFTDAEASATYGGPLSGDQAWSRLARDRGVWHLCGFGVWIIELEASGQKIGGCGFWQGRGWPRELTWWLLPEFRGRGIAAEASAAAIGHAYGPFGWETVQTYMTDENVPARALAQRLGGREAGRFSFPDGVERSIFVLPRPDGSYPRPAP